MRTINAELYRSALIKTLEEMEKAGDSQTDIADGVQRALRLLDMQDSVDAVEVRHGYWIASPDGINPIRCSECNMPAPFTAVENYPGDFEIYRYPSSYCHECGAKMDGERKKRWKN